MKTEVSKESAGELTGVACDLTNEAQILSLFETIKVQELRDEF
jgi:hypothetical protein